MARTGSVKHTHQYFKRTDGCWACSGYEEGCTHFMPKNMYPLPAGRKSICWVQGIPRHEFMLTHSNMRDAKPLCPECNERRAASKKVIDKFHLDDFKPNPLYTAQRMKELANETEVDEKRKKEIEELLRAEEEELRNEGLIEPEKDEDTSSEN